MSALLTSVAEVGRQIRDDAETDAMRVDSTPFTPRGIGETFGATLAMVAALGRCVAVLADELEATNRVLASRTEHLA